LYVETAANISGLDFSPQHDFFVYFCKSLLDKTLKCSILSTETVHACDVIYFTGIFIP